MPYYKALRHPVVCLFDLDGVLIQPAGYRASVRATVNDFTRRMGLPDLAPEDHTVAIYEAQGITCEWDMIPITLAIILEAVCEQLDEPLALDSLQQACDLIHARQLTGVLVNYEPILRGLGQYVRPGEAPAESLLAVSQQNGGERLFPRLRNQGVLRELFTHTRRPAHSPTTHVFQTYVLGDSVFASAMEMEPRVKTESLLAKYDRPLLAAATRDRLLEEAAGGLRMAAYTARPSIPLSFPGEHLAVFTPEAEIALELVGMQSIPVVGSGQMGEAAWRLGENEDRLTKPAPYHALAAIAAAWLGDRQAATAWMEQAYRALVRGEGAFTFQTAAGKLPQSLQLHIFEDSPAGMRGGLEAARILAGLGAQVEVKLWGVSDHPEKAAALAAVGATVFKDVNLAVDAMLASLE